MLRLLQFILRLLLIDWQTRLLHCVNGMQVGMELHILLA